MILCYLCPVKDLEELDIALLFGSLVLLKEDRTEPAEGVAKAAAPESETTSVALGESVQDDENPLQDWHSALICPLAIKAALERPNSNMRKILRALELEAVLEHILPVEKLKDPRWLQSLQAVWFVGLDAQRDKLSASLSMPYLFSADPERLKDVAEKRAMFEPLRDFAPNLQPKS